MLIVTIALGALVAILLVSRVNYLKDHKELEDKFKVAQAYAEDAAKANTQLTTANKAISAEIVALKSKIESVPPLNPEWTSDPATPPQRRIDRKLN